MVNSIRQLLPGLRRLACSAPVLAILLLPSPLFAQAPPIPDRLPPDTVLYVHWHGKASLTAASANNHLLQLYRDPDMARFWTALVNVVRGKKGNQGVSPGIVIAAASSLLENPAVVGFVANPNPQLTASPQSLMKVGGFFLVYDETGKADMIRMLTSVSDASAAMPSTVTNYAFGGTSVEVRTRDGNTIYSAHAGGYYLVSNQKRTIEDLVTRYQGSASPATSLGQLPEYQAVVKYLGSDTSLDIYGRLPNFLKWIPPGDKYKPLVRLVQSMHLEKVHAAGEGISFSGEVTRVRGVVLGDTSSGGLFDIVGPSSATFLTQPVVGTAPSFSISRLDLRALYQLIRAAIVAAMPPEKAGSIAMGEGMAQAYLGMPMPDALGLFTGEFAMAPSYSEDGTQEPLVAVTIQRPDDVLRVLRAAFGSVTIAEDSSGSTTYLDLLFPYKDPATGIQRRKFYYVAVTPKMVLVAPRKAMLRAAAVRLNSPSGAAPPGSIFADPQFIHLRSLLPASLSGLAGSEYARIPWDKIVARLADQTAQSQKQTNPPPPQFIRVLQQIDFAAISRHVHTDASGWWKDSTGIYFSSCVE